MDDFWCGLIICTLRNLVLPFFPLRVRISSATPVKAERKKYEKETEKYYSSLEKLLNMSAKKKEPQLQEVLTPARTLPPPVAASLSPSLVETKNAEMETCLLFSLPFLFLLLRLWPLDRATFHWRASQRRFSWPAWRGNVDSLALFGPKVRCGRCAARGRNSALCR